MAESERTKRRGSRGEEAPIDDDASATEMLDGAMLDFARTDAHAIATSARSGTSWARGDADEGDEATLIGSVSAQAPAQDERATTTLPSNGPSAGLGVIGGRYRVLSVIGSGGMGSVYEAEHIELAKRVAVKLLNSVEQGSQELAARFKREARSAGALDHENIVQVFDAGDDPSFGLYMVMELLKGDDLEKVIAANGALPPRVASRIVYQVCLGLEAAHGTGLLHRDLKPANIVLARIGGSPRDDARDATRAKIVDFGLAKLVREMSVELGALGRGNITSAGVVIGTPQYMSPEQAQGRDDIDARTDLYSLGAVFYEALVGAPLVPDFSSYEKTLFHILTTAPPRIEEGLRAAGRDPASVPTALADLVAAMLMPADLRIASARAVREKLLATYPDLDAQSITIPPPAVATPAKAQAVSGVVAARAPTPPFPIDALAPSSVDEEPAPSTARTPSAARPASPVAPLSNRALVVAMIAIALTVIAYLAFAR